MMPVRGKLGALPPYPDNVKPKLKLSPYLYPLPVKPSVDWYSRVASWPMYLNDRIGDCTCAEVGHQVESVAQYGQGAPILVQDADILAMYKAVSGYDGTPATDKGAVIQNVLNYWRKSGLAGHQNLIFAQVNHTDHAEVMQAVGIFGSLDLGFAVPASAMTQFEAGQPWDVVANDGGIEGGHSVELVGYDQDYLYVVTWGTIQRMTWAFWDKYVFESWAVVQPEWLNTHGKNPEGVDLFGLGEAFAQLTGQPNPFPAPVPPKSSGCLTITATAAILALLGWLRR